MLINVSFEISLAINSKIFSEPARLFGRVKNGFCEPLEV